MEKRVSSWIFIHNSTKLCVYVHKYLCVYLFTYYKIVYLKIYTFDLKPLIWGGSILCIAPSAWGGFYNFDLWIIICQWIAFKNIYRKTCLFKSSLQTSAWWDPAQWSSHLYGVLPFMKRDPWPAAIPLLKQQDFMARSGTTWLKIPHQWRLLMRKINEKNWILHCYVSQLEGIQVNLSLGLIGWIYWECCPLVIKRGLLENPQCTDDFPR